MLGKNVTVVCHPDAVIELEAGTLMTRFTWARKLFAMVTTYRRDGDNEDPNRKDRNGVIRWYGGTIFGNDGSPRNPSEFAPEFRDGDGGSIVNICMGFFVTNADLFEVAGVTVKEVRGHGVVHWGCERFSARSVYLDQWLTSGTAGFVPGTRRDGITGMSRHVSIENVSGFTNDDMVAIVSGSTWYDVSAPIVTQSVSIRGIRCGTKAAVGSDVQHGTTQGISIYSDSGAIGDIHIEDVSGTVCLGFVRITRSVRVGGGSVDRVLVSKVSGVVTNELAPLVTNSFTKSDNFTAFIAVRDVDVRSLLVTECAATYSADRRIDLPMVWVVRARIDTLSASDLVLEVLGANASDNPLVASDANASSDRPLPRIGLLSLGNVAIRRGATAAGGGGAIYWQRAQADDPTRVRLHDADVGQGSTLPQHVVVVAGKVIPLSREIVIDVAQLRPAGSADAGFFPSSGALVTTTTAGVLSCSDGQNWRQIERPTVDYAAPSAGQPALTGFRAGWAVDVVGAPFGALTGWYAAQKDSTSLEWVPIASNGTVYRNLTIAPLDLALTAFAPGVQTRIELDWRSTWSAPLSADLGTGQRGATLITDRPLAGNEAYASQTLSPQGLSALYRRTWSTATSTWSAWTRLTAVAM